MLNPALPSPSKQLNVAQINSLLKAHNDMRRDVYPAARTMPMLTWDQTLANFAYNYIQTCPGVTHSSNSVRTNPNAYNYGYVGENLAAGTNTAKYGIDGGAAAVGIWNSQARGYTYVGPPTCQSSDPHVCGTCNITDCGHYTQVAWGTTKTVGCAYAYCPGTTYLNYWICAYGPGGNYQGRPPYDASTPMDQCQMNGVPLSSFAHEAPASQRRVGEFTSAGSSARAPLKGRSEDVPLPTWLVASFSFWMAAIASIVAAAIAALFLALHRQRITGAPTKPAAEAI
jgi:hypothetical protein